MDEAVQFDLISSPSHPQLEAYGAYSGAGEPVRRGNHDRCALNATPSRQTAPNSKLDHLLTHMNTHADYAEERRSELEVLESIFPDELEGESAPSLLFE